MSSIFACNQPPGAGKNCIHYTRQLYRPEILISQTKIGESGFSLALQVFQRLQPDFRPQIMNKVERLMRYSCAQNESSYHSACAQKATFTQGAGMIQASFEVGER